ncbi:MAG: PaaI family thioesterase [Candidatus Firestonebacteria bacterium]
MLWEDDRHCIACGKNNPAGLKVDFILKDGKLSTSCIFPKIFQGYKDVVHGGMVGLMLDEVMVNLPLRLYGYPYVSAEFTVRLKAPAKIGEEVFFTAEIEKEAKGIVFVKGRAELKDGSLAASATAKCLRVPGEKLVKN